MITPPSGAGSKRNLVWTTPRAAPPTETDESAPTPPGSSGGSIRFWNDGAPVRTSSGHAEATTGHENSDSGDAQVEFMDQMYSRIQQLNAELDRERDETQRQALDVEYHVENRARVALDTMHRFGGDGDAVEESENFGIVGAQAPLSSSYDKNAATVNRKFRPHQPRSTSPPEPSAVLPKEQLELCTVLGKNAELRMRSRDVERQAEQASIDLEQTQRQMKMAERRIANREEKLRALLKEKLQWQNELKELREQVVEEKMRQVELMRRLETTKRETTAQIDTIAQALRDTEDENQALREYLVETKNQLATQTKRMEESVKQAREEKERLTECIMGARSKFREWRDGEAAALKAQKDQAINHLKAEYELKIARHQDEKQKLRDKVKDLEVSIRLMQKDRSLSPLELSLRKATILGSKESAGTTEAELIEANVRIKELEALLEHSQEFQKRQDNIIKVSESTISRLLQEREVAALDKLANQHLPGEHALYTGAFEPSIGPVGLSPSVPVSPRQLAASVRTQHKSSTAKSIGENARVIEPSPPPARPRPPTERPVAPPPRMASLNSPAHKSEPRGSPPSNPKPASELRPAIPPSAKETKIMEEIADIQAKLKDAMDAQAQHHGRVMEETTVESGAEADVEADGEDSNTVVNESLAPQPSPPSACHEEPCLIEDIETNSQDPPHTEVECESEDDPVLPIPLDHARDRVDSSEGADTEDTTEEIDKEAADTTGMVALANSSTQNDAVQDEPQESITLSAEDNEDPSESCPASRSAAAALTTPDKATHEENPPCVTSDPREAVEAVAPASNSAGDLAVAVHEAATRLIATVEHDVITKLSLSLSTVKLTVDDVRVDGVSDASEAGGYNPGPAEAEAEVDSDSAGAGDIASVTLSSAEPGNKLVLSSASDEGEDGVTTAIVNSTVDDVPREAIESSVLVDTSVGDLSVRPQPADDMVPATGEKSAVASQFSPVDQHVDEEDRNPSSSPTRNPVDALSDDQAVVVEATKASPRDDSVQRTAASMVTIAVAQAVGLISMTRVIQRAQVQQTHVDSTAAELDEAPPALAVDVESLKLDDTDVELMGESIVPAERVVDDEVLLLPESSDAGVVFSATEDVTPDPVMPHASGPEEQRLPEGTGLPPADASAKLGVEGATENPVPVGTVEESSERELVALQTATSDAEPSAVACGSLAIAITKAAEISCESGEVLHPSADPNKSVDDRTLNANDEDARVRSPRALEEEMLAAHANNAESIPTPVPEAASELNNVASAFVAQVKAAALDRVLSPRGRSPSPVVNTSNQVHALTEERVRHFVESGVAEVLKSHKQLPSSEDRAKHDSEKYCEPCHASDHDKQDAWKPDAPVVDSPEESGDAEEVVEKHDLSTTTSTASSVYEDGGAAGQDTSLVQDQLPEANCVENSATSSETNASLSPTNTTRDSGDSDNGVVCDGVPISEPTSAPGPEESITCEGHVIATQEPPSADMPVVDNPIDQPQGEIKASVPHLDVPVGSESSGDDPVVQDPVVTLDSCQQRPVHPDVNEEASPCLEDSQPVEEPAAASLDAITPTSDMIAPKPCDRARPTPWLSEAMDDTSLVTLAEKPIAMMRTASERCSLPVNRSPPLTIVDSSRYASAIVQEQIRDPTLLAYGVKHEQAQPFAMLDETILQIDPNAKHMQHDENDKVRGSIHNGEDKPLSKTLTAIEGVLVTKRKRMEHESRRKSIAYRIIPAFNYEPVLIKFQWSDFVVATPIRLMSSVSQLNLLASLEGNASAASRAASTTGLSATSSGSSSAIQKILTSPIHKMKLLMKKGIKLPCSTYVIISVFNRPLEDGNENLRIQIYDPENVEEFQYDFHEDHLRDYVDEWTGADDEARAFVARLEFRREQGSVIIKMPEKIRNTSPTERPEDAVSSTDSSTESRVYTPPPMAQLLSVIAAHETMELPPEPQYRLSPNAPSPQRPFLTIVESRIEGEECIE